MIYGISLILLSIIAVPSLILSKKPNAKELLDKVEPYQGWIGVIFSVFGIWGIISSLLSLNVLSSAPIWWFTLFIGSIVEATLGFLLGFPIITKMLSKNASNYQEKSKKLREKLVPLQGKVGIVGVISGIWIITASFLFTV